jgi:hypothetical protein
MRLQRRRKMSKLEGLDTRGINSNDEEPTTFDMYLRKRQCIKHQLGSEGFDNVIRGFELADKCHDMFDIVDELYKELQDE